MPRDDLSAEQRWCEVMERALSVGVAYDVKPQLSRLLG